MRHFVDNEIIPHVGAWEEASSIPRDLYPKAAKAGLLGLGYPESLGGSGQDSDILHSIITSEELA